MVLSMKEIYDDLVLCHKEQGCENPEAQAQQELNLTPEEAQALAS